MKRSDSGVLMGYPAATALLEAGGLPREMEVGQDDRPFPEVLTEPEGQILAPAAPSRFSLQAALKRNERSQVRVKIAGFNPGFRGWFLRGGQFVEGSTGPMMLRYENLYEAASDDALISNAGGERRAIVGLAHIAALLLLDAERKPSGLLVDGRTNHFYVRRRSLQVTAVRVRMEPGGWYVGAFGTSKIEGFMDVWTEGRFFWRA